MTQAGLAALVHGLQLSCLVTYGAMVGYRGGALLRELGRLPWRVSRMIIRFWPEMLQARPIRWLVKRGRYGGLDDRDDQRWAALVLLAVSQVGFSARWLIYPETIDGMPARELAPWALAYAVSAVSAVLIAWSQGDRVPVGRDRLALIFHATATGLSILAAAWTA